MKKKIGFLVFIIIVLIFILVDLLAKKPENNIVYSWSMDAVNDKSFIEILSEHDITTVYQDFSSEYLSTTENDFLKDLSDASIEVYHLAGEPEWGTDKDATRMIKEIDKVLNYNDNVQNDIKGIVLDVETYSIEEDEFDFELFVESMKTAYDYAKEKKLRMIIAIPIWFDSEDEELLEELIKDGCDGISLMNYNIKRTKKNMESEVQLAIKYDKDIDNIYEIEFDDKDSFSSYDEIDKDFNNIKREYDYSKLRKTYHYYDKIKKYHHVEDNK